MVGIFSWLKSGTVLSLRAMIPPRIIPYLCTPGSFLVFERGLMGSQENQRWGELRSLVNQPGLLSPSELVQLLRRWHRPADTDERLIEYLKPHAHWAPDGPQPPEPWLLNQWMHGQLLLLLWLASPTQASRFFIQKILASDYAGVLKKLQYVLSDQRHGVDCEWRYRTEEDFMPVYHWLHEHTARKTRMYDCYDGSPREVQRRMRETRQMAEQRGHPGYWLGSMTFANMKPWPGWSNVDVFTIQMNWSKCFVSSKPHLDALQWLSVMECCWQIEQHLGAHCTAHLAMRGGVNMPGGMWFLYRVLRSGQTTLPR